MNAQLPPRHREAAPAAVGIPASAGGCGHAALQARHGELAGSDIRDLLLDCFAALAKTGQGV
ncbi:MAG: hypothetical protein ACLPIX_22390 [Rhodomicrobium sp.]